MAGLSWFELEIDFPDHPKSARLGVLLKNPVAYGWVVRLWAYCYKHATDRFVAPGAEEQVEQAAGWRGKAGALVAALLEVGYLDRDGDDLLAHGVGERLAPHLAKKKGDRERAQNRRDVAAKSLQSRANVSKTSSRRSADVFQHTDSYTDRNSNRSEITIGSDPQPPFEPPAAIPVNGSAGGGGLDSFCVALAQALGLPRIGLGRKPDRAAAAVSRLLPVLGEDALVAECVRLARERGVTPAHLTWWAGWLDTVPLDAHGGPP